VRRRALGVRLARRLAALAEENRALRVEARAQAETAAELRRSEERYAALLDSIDGIVWQADARTFRFELVSSKAERVLGYPVGRWLDEPTFWADHLHPEDRDIAVSFCAGATAGGRDHELEYRMIAADGRAVWLHDRVTVVMEDGRPRRLRGIMTDISARKQVEAESALLREQVDESHALLDAVFRTAPVGLAYHDRALRYVRINEDLAAMNGLPVEAHVGRTLTEVIPSIAPQVLAYFRGVLATGRPVLGLEVRGEAPSAPGETRYWLGSFYPVRRGDVVLGVGVVVQDITEQTRSRLRIEELAVERGRLLAEARAALRARDAFVGIASHELKTPLTPLRLNLQIVRRDLDAAGAARLAERVDVALRQVDRLARQVETMLDVTRCTPGQLAVTRVSADVAALVRGVAARFAKVATRAGSTLAVDAGAPARADVDPARVAQVVEELLVNAVRYGAGKAIAVRVSAEEHAVRIVVEDGGIGIPPADRERIFGLFERAAPLENYGGLGLGLFLARRIVEAHGGRIRCESPPPGGTRFEVELPA
jgi:PAS domain S-box-containing protein